MICPVCNKHGAKKSESYPDIIVHKCNGQDLVDVSTISFQKPSYKTQASIKEAILTLRPGIDNEIVRFILLQVSVVDRSKFPTEMDFFEACLNKLDSFFGQNPDIVSLAKRLLQSNPNN